jgi:hypothetical protein
VPAVITPLPPLPARAIDRLAPARGAVWVVEACTSFLLRFRFAEVTGRAGQNDLTQIKASAIDLLHYPIA